MYKRVCEVCFKPFETENRRRKYCSHECYSKARNRFSAEAKKRREITKEVLESQKNTLHIAKLAHDAGMSYGKYVQAYLRGETIKT